ncbi:MAG: PilT/PilU family type 4a pilus ATPase, partial [Bradymonadaceae bacterium]
RVAELEAVDTLGEIGLLLDDERTATVVARSAVTILEFGPEVFRTMYKNVPTFGLGVSRTLAERLRRTSHRLPVPDADVDDEEATPSEDLIDRLPQPFMERHRVVPLSIDDERVELGVVDDPSSQLLSAVQEQFPGLEIEPKRISLQVFNRAFENRAGSGTWDRLPTDILESAETIDDDEESLPTIEPEAEAGTDDDLPRKLNQLLLRTVSEGATDLHLSADQRPRWRIDGQIHELEDSAPMGTAEVQQLLEPVMTEGDVEEFRDQGDVDFGLSVEGLSRFRVNMFVDHNGVGAVFRQIPSEIMTIDQLGLPEVVKHLAEQPKGLVLVTGPTSSGKMTTIAAMLDHINRRRREHIITIEDPVEYLHESHRSLVNQREVGVHTESFATALRAALREDPDVILVGELRDLETLRTAIETANTGHLVFGSLHTSTAATTIDRILGLFPADEEEQVRSTLAEGLRGVISQVLCRRRGGGQIAAYETMICNHAIANLIRESKTHQIPQAMQSHRDQGNILLNETLAEYVRRGTVDFREAASQSIDRSDLAKRLGRESDGRF